MSILPYGRPESSGWFFASSGSLAAHALVGVFILGGLQPLLLAAPPSTDAPRYSVTLQPLDSDTLAGLELREGLAGAEILEDSSANVDPLQPVEGLESLTAEDIDEEELAALGPDNTDATPLPTGPEPVLAEPVEADPVAPDTQEQETATLAQVTADPVPQDSPLSPLIPEDTNPLIPETVTAIASSGVATISAAPVSSRPSPDAVAVLQNEALRPVAVPSSGASAGQPAEAQDTTTSARPPASAQDLAVGNLIRKIRENTGPDCLLTLPRRDGEAGVGLDMMATRDTAFSEFSRTTLTQGDETLRQTRTLLDPRQCPAVDYIRDNRDYPATRLGLRLDTPNVVSGNRITGVLRGTGGKYVALLLVDNNGVVQDLQRFLSQSGNFTRFDVPVTRAGPRRDTAQILLAVASSNPLQQIRDRSGRLAADVFAGLHAGLTGREAIAVTTFDVR